MPPGAFVDWAKDVFPALLAGDGRSTCWRLESYWNDVGNIEQYRVGNFDALLGRVRARYRDARSTRACGSARARRSRPACGIEPPVLLGAGCLVEAGAELIGPLIVGDGCVVDRGAVLEGVIHWDGAKAGRDSRLAGSILGRNVIVHHEAVVHEDAVMGDRSDVAAHALVDAGARLEPRTRPSTSRRADLHGGGATRRDRPRLCKAEGALDRPARPAVPAALRGVCQAAGAWLCPTPAPTDLQSLARRTAAGAAARPCGRAGSAHGTAPFGRAGPAHARLP